LSGAHSATVVGTGAYPTRTTLTFTPSAGNLTLTVTGTVQFAQLETGAFATSYIPTEASQVTRTDDVATMTGTNFSDWFNATEGSFYANYSRIAVKRFSRVFAASNAAQTEIISLSSGAQAADRENVTIVSGGSPIFLYPGVTPAGGVNVDYCFGYKSENSAASINGGVPVTDATSFATPTLTQLNIGSIVLSGQYLNGHIKKLSYWPQRLTNNEIRAFSK